MSSSRSCSPLRPPGARGRSRCRARRAARGTWGDTEGTSRGLSHERRFPHRRGCICGIRSRRRRERCCSRRRRWSSSSRARTSPTTFWRARCGARANWRCARRSVRALRRSGARFAESLLLCGAGAVLGILIARPMLAVLARYAARFSVRALDLTVDASLLWVGVVLAVVAAISGDEVPRREHRPSPDCRRSC
jgi:hypothetical protein